VSYDPNGVKHTQIGAKFYAAPALVDVYNTIQSLYEQNRWRELAEASERQIENHPDWLTPYLYAGVAYANSGEKALAVKRLDYFRAHASERPDYAGWHQDAVRLLAALGATEP
jgi:hypothetical protein